MEKFIAKQSCKFGGKIFYSGEEIPQSLIDPKFIGALIEMEIISKVDVPIVEVSAETPSVDNVDVPIVPKKKRR